MNKIEAFVDSVYQNVGGNKKEIQELKAEMKAHLLEAVHELKSEGKTEEEAIIIAIERFGGEKEMRSGLGQLFKAQKTFAKWLLVSALAFLVLGFIIFGVMIEIGDANVENSQETAFKILESLEDREVLSEDIKNVINSIAIQNEDIKRIAIYNNQDNDPDVFRTEPDYIYERDGWVSHVQSEGYSNDPATNQNYGWHIDIDTKIQDGLAVNILLVAVAAYWVLFTIWAIINAYHHRRLNAGWVITFALLNIVGYLIYVLEGKRKVRI